MTHKIIKYQLIPTNSHRIKCVEKAIQMWKYYCIVGISIIDKQWYMRLCCCLQNQCDLTLYLLRSSRINSNMLVFLQLEELYDFNDTLLVPLCMKYYLFMRYLNNENMGLSWSPRVVLETCTRPLSALQNILYNTRGRRKFA